MSEGLKQLWTLVESKQIGKLECNVHLKRKFC